VTCRFCAAQTAPYDIHSGRVEVCLACDTIYRADGSVVFLSRRVGQIPARAERRPEPIIVVGSDNSEQGTNGAHQQEGSRA
jgi:hypothetical protein